jgi:predicted site-specific integrase-resolvase
LIGSAIRVHKTSPFFSHRFIEDLCVLQWCSVYSSFMNTAVYVRVSTEAQRTDSQEQELRRYCRQRGWKNLTFFTDRISGAKASRPELDKLMQRVRAGEVERLVVY